jgi:hypothetical protein
MQLNADIHKLLQDRGWAKRELDRQGKQADLLEEKLKELEKMMEAFGDRPHATTEYEKGYSYGKLGKFPLPTGMSPEWVEGYSDGRGDWLASIQ